ncbi:MAG: cytochrome P450 [Novosphingobium sp.]|nr:MAG: cytochrome P450 [Novosphingobium sp.]
MQTLADLTLHSLPMAAPAFSANPWPELEKARASHPWLAACEFGHVVHQYDAMRDLLWLDHSLTGSYEDMLQIMEAEGTPWGRFQQESLLAQTGEAHRRIRAVLAPAFTPQQANKHRPLMRKVIAELLDEWVPKGQFDFEDFASYFPITVMCSLIGAPTGAIASLRASMEALGLSMSMDKAFLPQLNQATDVLDAFAQDIVAQRRKARLAPGEDMLEVLLATLDEGKVTERELYDLLIFLFVAGYDTSKNALTLMMDALIDRPEMYQRCAEDLAWCKKVSEENFRYLTTSTIPRIVTKDIAYKDVLIPAGTLLFFPVSISGRDPVIEDAANFDPERDQAKKRPITFGMGVHICLGQFIARAQIEEGLHQIAQRIRQPRRTGPSAWRPFYGVWGLKGLPIAFEAVRDSAEAEPAL